jgi:hypothetical protein
MSPKLPVEEVGIVADDGDNDGDDRVTKGPRSYFLGR